MLHSNLLVEFDCLEMIYLLTDIMNDITEVSLSLLRRQRFGVVFGVISFSYVCWYHYYYLSFSWVQGLRAA